MIRFVFVHIFVFFTFSANTHAAVPRWCRVIIEALSGWVPNSATYKWSDSLNSSDRETAIRIMAPGLKDQVDLFEIENRFGMKSPYPLQLTSALNAFSVWRRQGTIVYIPERENIENFNPFVSHLMSMIDFTSMRLIARNAPPEMRGINFWNYVHRFMVREFDHSDSPLPAYFDYVVRAMTLEEAEAIARYIQGRPRFDASEPSKLAWTFRHVWRRGPDHEGSDALDEAVRDFSHLSRMIFLLQRYDLAHQTDLAPRSVVEFLSQLWVHYFVCAQLTPEQTPLKRMIFSSLEHVQDPTVLDDMLIRRANDRDSPGEFTSLRYAQEFFKALDDAQASDREGVTQADGEFILFLRRKGTRESLIGKLREWLEASPVEGHSPF